MGGGCAQQLQRRALQGDLVADLQAGSDGRIDGIARPELDRAGSEAGGSKIISFLVDPQEALILKYIKDSGGIIDMIVRSLDATQVNATDPVNVDYLVDLYKFIGLPKK